MIDAGVIYLVRYWVRPETQVAFQRYLTEGHIADVMSQPGFTWARQLDLQRAGEDGWQEYLILYGVESRACLEAYFASPTYARFALQFRPFKSGLRVDRVVGAVITAIGAAPAIAE